MVSFVPSGRRSPGGVGLPALAVDQALYSGSNFVLAAVAARSLSAAEFGRFAFVILFVSIAANLGKAVWHEPDLATGRVSLGRRWVAPTVVGGGLALALTGGLYGGIPMAALAAGAMVIVVAQDRLRYRLFAVGRAGAAALADLVWLAVILIGFAPGRGETGVEVLALWMVGAAVSCGVAAAALTGGEAQGPADGSVRSVHPLSPVTAGRRLGLLADFALSSGMTQIGALAVGLVMAADRFADLRTAVIVFGPVGVATGAVTTWIFATHGDRRRSRSEVFPVAAALASVCLVLAAVLVALPPEWGAVGFGASWPGRLTLAAIGCSVAAQAVGTPAMMLLRRQGRMRSLLTVRVVAFAAFLATTVALAATVGRAEAVAATYAPVNAALAWAAWRRVDSQSDSQDGAGSGADRPVRPPSGRAVPVRPPVGPPL